MTNFVNLKKTVPAEDICRGLRRLADAIEAGTEVDWPVTTCLVVIGHTESVLKGEIIEDTSHVASYGFGPRCDPFTVAGLLTCALED